VGDNRSWVDAAPGNISRSRHGEIVRYHLSSCSQLIVKFTLRKREVRGHMGNLPQMLEIKRISCGSQYTIPDMTRMMPHPEGTSTNMRISEPYETSHTADFTHRLISSMLCPTSSSTSRSDPPLCNYHRTPS